MSQPTADDEIQYPSGFGLKDVIGWGTTGFVVLDKSTIFKTPFDHTSEQCLMRAERERLVYERFAQHGGHAGLLTYHGKFESGIRLEYAPNKNLRLHLRKGEQLTHEQRLRWAIQIAKTTQFVHSAGVIHGDLTCANILLDAELNAKVADFAGSSLDGSPLLVVDTESHEYPGPLLSVKADLFALGSVLYEIMTGHTPYEGLGDSKIAVLYREGKFPDVGSMGGLGIVIQGCWRGCYSGTEKIVVDLKGQCRNLQQT